MSFFVSGELDKASFKQRLENYFKFTEATFTLQHIAENPWDYSKWFDVFYQWDSNEETKEKRITNKVINSEQQQSLLANLSRILESYQNNTGLDFVSGLLRLMVDNFENSDGKDRFVSAFRQILSLPGKAPAYIQEQLLKIGKTLKSKNKNELTETLCSFYPGNRSFIREIQLALNDDYTGNLIAREAFETLKNLNKEIYAKLHEIG